MLNNHLKLNKFETPNDLPFNIDIGSSNIILYVDNLSVKGPLNILGSGSLTIYVKNNLDLNNSAKINPSSNNLNIYYVGNNKITMENNLILNANLFIKETDIEITTGAKFNGSIYSKDTGKTTINGGSVSKDVVFIMPNSNFTITGGANVVGTILCKDILFEGGAKVDAQAGGGLGDSGTIHVDNTNPIQLKPIAEVKP